MTEIGDVILGSGSVDYEDIVRALFRGALGREISPNDLSNFTKGLKNGFPLSTMIADLVGSDEFAARQHSPLVVTLPSLYDLYPDRYYRGANNNLIYRGTSRIDIDFLEDCIKKYRYYDSFGIWTPEIDRDKRITASIIDALGVKSCLEIGCYSGSVLSLLDKAGVDVRGVEISHRAFLFAEQTIYDKIQYGDLLDLSSDKKYDAFLAMDVLEHLNPSKFDLYIARIASLLSENGIAYINSPMVGHDRVFQQVFGVYVDEWAEVGDTNNWHHIHCDEKGWPVHGHLVWASPAWWENAFRKHGLVRDTEAELVVQTILADFFLRSAPARKSFFILRHSAAGSIDASELRKRLSERVSKVLQDEGAEHF